MTAFGAATLYTGLFGVMFIGLKLNAGRVRASSKVDIGDGGNAEMERAMRVQSNAVEDVPVVLIGLFGLAAVSAPVSLIHVFGGSFVAFRLLHALGLGGAPGLGWGRVIGTIGTLLVGLGTGGSCIWFALN